MDTRQSLINKLVTKTQADKDLRNRLLTDPNSVLKEVLNVELPEGFKVMVHEEDARTAHLVLPPPAELTDEQLQQAAGGVCDFFWDPWV